MFAISARVGTGETGPFPLANMSLLTSGRGFAGPRNPNTCRARRPAGLNLVLRATCQPARLLVKAMTTRGKQCVISETTCKTVPIC